MAMNRIQFQPGLSLPDFLKAYGTELQCEQALAAVRWPDGFRCPRCEGAGHSVFRDGPRQVFQCTGCRHQASLIAGTVFQGTKLPLTTWFLAIYFDQPGQDRPVGLGAEAPTGCELSHGVADPSQIAIRFHTNLRDWDSAICVVWRVLGQYYFL